MAVILPPAGALEPDIVARAKAATVLVITEEGTGSGFCISPSGLFVTNAHVVQSVPIQGELTVVLSPGEDNQRVATGRLLAQSAEIDLAVFKVAMPHNKRGFVLKLGDSSALAETQSVTAFGYPFGQALAMSREDHPSISVNVGRITALRREAGTLKAVQTDISLNPGNSGGPIVDETGSVVGIVSFGVLNSGVNFAIPVNDLRSFLRQPLISMSPQRFDPADRTGPQQFLIEVAYMLEPEAQFEVELSLLNQTAHRRFSARYRGRGVYAVETTLTPDVESGDGVQNDSVLSANLTLDDGSVVSAQVVDKPFQIGRASTRLSRIRVIDFDDETKVTGRTGKTVTAPVSGLLPLEAEFQGRQITIREGQVRSITFSELPKTSTLALPIPYEISVHRAQQVIATTRGVLTFEDPPAEVAEATEQKVDQEAPSTRSPPSAARVPVPIRPDPLLSLPKIMSLDAERTLELAGPVVDVAVGGHGRYLILHIPQMGRAEIFDCAKLDTIGSLEVGGNSAFVAAGASYAVVVDGDAKTVRFAPFKNLDAVESFDLPVPGPIVGATMGRSAESAVLIAYRNPNGSILNQELLMQCDLLQRGITKDKVLLPVAMATAKRLDMRSNAAGTIYTAFAGHQAVAIITVTDQIQVTERTGRMYPVPSLIEPTFLGGGTKTLYIDGTVLAEIEHPTARAVHTIPTFHPSFYALLSSSTHIESKGISLSILPNNGSLALAKLETPLEEFSEAMGDASGIHGHMREPLGGLSTDQRVHIIPQLELLVTLPFSNDRLVLRPLDMEALRTEQNPDYLFVTSSPPRYVQLGTALSYQLGAISESGETEFRVEIGPPGCEITESALLTWQPPPSTLGQKVRFVLSAIDSSTLRERFHSFEVEVVDVSQ